MQDLDSKDHKILYHLFLNSRESLSAIGKKVGLPKTVVKYRIEIFSLFILIDSY